MKKKSTWMNHFSLTKREPQRDADLILSDHKDHCRYYRRKTRTKRTNLYPLKSEHFKQENGT